MTKGENSTMQRPERASVFQHMHISLASYDSNKQTLAFLCTTWTVLPEIQ